MNAHLKRTGPAIEAHYQFLLWLVPSEPTINSCYGSFHRHAHERTQQRRQRDQQTDRRVVEVEVGLYLMRERRDHAPRGERHRECGGCQREIDVRLPRVLHTGPPVPLHRDS
jgi:hypothetical protein